MSLNNPPSSTRLPHDGTGQNALEAFGGQVCVGRAEIEVERDRGHGAGVRGTGRPFVRLNDTFSMIDDGRSNVQDVLTRRTCAA